MSNESTDNPRYLRFLRTLLMGSALAATPLVASSCTDDDDDEGECAGDECTADAKVVDASVVVDGPLPPPDLPKLV